MMDDNSLEQIQLIDEDELEVSDEISLTLELIRLLEKDIDDEQSRNSKDGWTTFGVLGAIVGAVFLLLGQTKDLQEIPVDTSVITVTFVFLFQFLFSAYNFLTGNGSFVKEKNLIDSKKIFGQGNAFIFVRIFILSLVSIVICFLDYPIWIKITSMLLVFMPAIFFIFYYFLSRYIEIPMGNTPKSQKVTSISGFTFLLFQLIAILLVGNQLTFPVGQSQSAAYVIGFSISAIVFLTEVLLSFTSPPKIVGDLQNLKDDIVFRRLGINESLNKYKILKEGKSLFDQMKPSYNQLMNCLYREEEIYLEKKRILKKISELLPLKSDTEKVTNDKNEQTSILTNSLETYKRELNGLILLVSNDLMPPFYKKLKLSAQASGDFEAETIIHNLIDQKIRELVQKEREINLETSNLMNNIANSGHKLK
jgi:hypothetical protein